MEKPFFQALVDSSFTTFITRRVATVLYVIVMILLGLVTLASVVAGAFMFSDTWTREQGLLLLIFGPLVSLLSLILVRLGFESAVALVLIAESTTKKKSSKEA